MNGDRSMRGADWYEPEPEAPPKVPPHATRCGCGVTYRGLSRCPSCDAARPGETTSDTVQPEEEADDVPKVKQCPKGHAKTAANTDGRGGCRQCARDWQRAYAERKRANGVAPKKRTAPTSPVAAPAPTLAQGIALLRAERVQTAARLEKIDQALAVLEELGA